MIKKDPFHIVKNSHFKDIKWNKISKRLNIPRGVVAGIHSAILCFGATTKGKISYSILQDILIDFSLQDMQKSIFLCLCKFNVIDKDYNIVKWNSHQLNFLHNTTTTQKPTTQKGINNATRKEIFQKSLISIVNGEKIQYIVSKSEDISTYNAWHNQRRKKHISNEDIYEKLTKMGYKISVVKINDTENNIDNIEKKQNDSRCSSVVDALYSRCNSEKSIDNTQKINNSTTQKKERCSSVVDALYSRCSLIEPVNTEEKNYRVRLENNNKVSTSNYSIDTLLTSFLNLLYKESDNLKSITLNGIKNYLNKYSPQIITFFSTMDIDDGISCIKLFLNKKFPELKKRYKDEEFTTEIILKVISKDFPPQMTSLYEEVQTIKKNNNSERLKIEKMKKEYIEIQKIESSKENNKELVKECQLEFQEQFREFTTGKIMLENMKPRIFAITKNSIFIGIDYCNDSKSSTILKDFLNTKRHLIDRIGYKKDISIYPLRSLHIRTFFFIK